MAPESNLDPAALQEQIADLEHQVALLQRNHISLRGMAPEIQVPLKGIIGLAGFLLDTSLNDEQLEFTKNIKSMAETALQVFDLVLEAQMQAVEYLAKREPQ